MKAPTRLHADDRQHFTQQLDLGRFNRIGQFLGLVGPDAGDSTRRRRRSRYGMYVSARLDDDIEELRRRLAMLEQRDSEG